MLDPLPGTQDTDAEEDELDPSQDVNLVSMHSDNYIAAFLTYTWNSLRQRTSGMKMRNRKMRNMKVISGVCRSTKERPLRPVALQLT